MGKYHEFVCEICVLYSVFCVPCFYLCFAVFVFVFVFQCCFIIPTALSVRDERLGHIFNLFSLIRPCVQYFVFVYCICILFLLCIFTPALFYKPNSTQSVRWGMRVIRSLSLFTSPAVASILWRIYQCWRRFSYLCSFAHFFPSLPPTLFQSYVEFINAEEKNLDLLS